MSKSRNSVSLMRLLMVVYSPHIQTPTILGWGLFLCAPAKPREHARKCE